MGGFPPRQWCNLVKYSFWAYMPEANTWLQQPYCALAKRLLLHNTVPTYRQTLCQQITLSSPAGISYEVHSRTGALFIHLSPPTPHWTIPPSFWMGVDDVPHQFQTPTPGWSSASPEQIAIIASLIWLRVLSLIQCWLQRVVLQQQCRVDSYSACEAAQTPRPHLPYCCLITYSLFCVCLLFCLPKRSTLHLS